MVAECATKGKLPVDALFAHEMPRCFDSLFLVRQVGLVVFAEGNRALYGLAEDGTAVAGVGAQDAVFRH